MNTYLLIAAILCFVLGIAHSVLGEFLIFNSKRFKGNLVPSKQTEDLKERHLRILWATWHLASVFGSGIGAILMKLSLSKSQLNVAIADVAIQPIIYTMLLSSILVLIGTKGKHPGWVVLLSICVLIILGYL
jgi:hypothetical protein